MSIFQKHVNISLNLCPKHVLLGIIKKKLAPQGALLAPWPAMGEDESPRATWGPVLLYIYIYDIYISLAVSMRNDVQVKPTRRHTDFHH